MGLVVKKENIMGEKEYIELRLIKVTDYQGKTEYFAVDDKTGENMENGATERQYIHKHGLEYKKMQIQCDDLGPIAVQQPPYSLY